MTTNIPLRFRSVSAITQPYDPSVVYLVEDPNPDFVQFYVSNSTGTALRRIPLQSDIVAYGGNWYATHWRKTLSPTVSLNDGTSRSLFDIVTDADKLPISTTDPVFRLNIQATTGKRFVQAVYSGQEAIRIRMSAGVTGFGGTRMYRFNLRRKTDDSLISSTPVVIDPNDVPEGIVTTSALSYINLSDDPFVTGGFYVEISNNSGVDATLNFVDVLIFREPF